VANSVPFSRTNIVVALPVRSGRVSEVTTSHAGESGGTVLAGSGFLPFVIAVERHEIAPLPEGLAEGGLRVDLLGARIDGREADFDVLGPIRDQAPALSARCLGCEASEFSGNKFDEFCLQPALKGRQVTLGCLFF